MLQIETAFRYY